MLAFSRSALALVVRFVFAPALGALATVVVGLWTGIASAQAPAPLPVAPTPQVVQLPDGSYVVILPPQTPTGVPPSYASPPPAYAEPPRPSYTPPALPSGTPYGRTTLRDARFVWTRDDVLARIGPRLHRERTGLVVGTVGAAVCAFGIMLVWRGRSADGDVLFRGTGTHMGGAAMIVLGAGAGFGGFATSSIAGLRTSRDFALLGAPNGRGTAITSIVALALVESSPLAIPLGWLHYGRARRHYAMLTGGQPRATLELSIRPMIDRATGLRGAALAGSF